MKPIPKIPNVAASAVATSATGPVAPTTTPTTPIKEIILPVTVKTSAELTVFPFLISFSIFPIVNVAADGLTAKLKAGWFLIEAQ